MRILRRSRGALAAALAALAAHAAPAAASMFAGETLDKVADVIAIGVLVLVPVVVIVVFWLVHVLPERFAEKRHHPQTEAITTLCLLSLVFGGLLWPLAWLWAFTKPVGYKVAYGTEKHDAYFDEMHEKHLSGGLTDAEAEALRDELDAMAAKGTLPARLQRLRERLDLGAPAAGDAAASGGNA